MPNKIISRDEKIDYLTLHAPYSLREFDLDKLGVKSLMKEEVRSYLSRSSIHEINTLYEEAPSKIKKIQSQMGILELSELKESERNSVYLIIAALVYDWLGHDPTKKKSSTSSEISSLVTQHTGHNIEADTVRKWIAKVCEKFPKLSSDKT